MRGRFVVLKLGAFGHLIVHSTWDTDGQALQAIEQSDERGLFFVTEMVTRINRGKGERLTEPDSGTIDPHVRGWHR